MMNDGYSIVPAMTAIIYALAAAIGIGLFVLAGPCRAAVRAAVRLSGGSRGENGRL
jgi:hypothetical protein